METKTTIEAVEIVNDELIDVLAQVAQYHQEDVVSEDPELHLVGDGSTRLLTQNPGVGDHPTTWGSKLVSGGEIRDSILVDGESVPLNVL